MYDDDALRGLYQFLRSTGEAPLRKMVVANTFTENHFQILLKIVRGTSEDEFLSHCRQQDFPKVRLSPSQAALKETFWSKCMEACEKVGLISKSNQVMPSAA